MKPVLNRLQGSTSDKDGVSSQPELNRQSSSSSGTGRSAGRTLRLPPRLLVRSRSTEQNIASHKAHRRRRPPLRRDADGASEISHGGELRRRRLLDARSQKQEPASSPEPGRTEFELFDLHCELGPGRLLRQLLSREELGIPQRRRTPHLEGARRSNSRQGPTSPSSPCTGSSSRFRSRGGQLATGTSRVQGRQLATGARRAAGVRVPGADAQRVDGRFATATLRSDEVQGAHRAVPGHVGTCRAEPLEKASARGGENLSNQRGR